METMRREGFEFGVGPPSVITRRDESSGAMLEPVEDAMVEVGQDYVGSVVDLMAGRRAGMQGMDPGPAGTTRLRYRLPTRGLLGLRSALLTATRGTAVLSTLVAGWEPWAGELAPRDAGSLTAHETGQVTAYAIESAQQRGRLFVRPGDQVYEDQVVGIHQRAGDLKVNVCRKKALTNMRAATKDTSAVLNEPIAITLDFALEVRTPPQPAPGCLGLGFETSPAPRGVACAVADACSWTEAVLHAMHPSPPPPPLPSMWAQTSWWKSPPRACA